MQQETTRRRVPTQRRRLRQTLLPYASYAALTGLQIIFLFSFFHDSLAIRLLLYAYAVLVGVWGSVPLLRALTSRKTGHTVSLPVFQRALPSLLLLAWGESHLLDCSYIPFNRLAVTVWLVYTVVGLFFGLVRAAHRNRLLREQKIAAEYAENTYASPYNRVEERDSAFASPAHSLLTRREASIEPETVVAGRL
jgi:hypothetical protein